MKDFEKQLNMVLRLVRQPQQYYHISDKYLGNACVLKPRLPRFANEDEPPIKRVCLAPTPEGAVTGAGLFAIDDDDVAYLYQTEKIIAYDVPAEIVADAEDVGECWSFEPVRVTFLKELSADELRALELE